MVAWDEAVNMPTGSGEARNEAMVELETLIHDEYMSPDVAELISRAESEVDELNEWQAANLREMRTRWLRHTSVSKDLVQRLTFARMKCEQAWRTLRVENNWKTFAPLLNEVVQCGREEAQQRSESSGLAPYDSMLDLYEEGVTEELIDFSFEPLRKFLPNFIPEVVEKQKNEKLVYQEGLISKDHQRALSIKIMEFLGFNFEKGRLDTSHHPFCGGVPDDVRITTRYSESDFTECLMSVIHETGHGSYEQGLPIEWRGQPAGSAMGMAFHESQSLFYEMQIGRSESFLNAVTPILKEFLGREGDPARLWESENLHRLFTRVMPGYIRVNADEATYPLHIMMRYEIEKELIAGSLSVKDIPEVWDTKMYQYLGLRTEGNFKDGCMQDGHWAAGAFGYFPSYTLGAMIAAQLFQAMEESLPNVQSEILSGDLLNVKQWLNDHIWSKGSTLNFNDLLVKATGDTLNSQIFIRHLKKRFLED